MLCVVVELRHVVLWLLGASEVIGVRHRRTSSSSASRRRCRQIDGIAGVRRRENAEGLGRANRGYGIDCLLLALTHGIHLLL
jgi:hypothetical protein